MYSPPSAKLIASLGCACGSARCHQLSSQLSKSTNSLRRRISVLAADTSGADDFIKFNSKHSGWHGHGGGGGGSP